MIFAGEKAHYNVYVSMKKVLILCGLVAAFMCLSQKAEAQIAPGYFYVENGQIVTLDGYALSDHEVYDLVGADIYHDTYVGARKQYTVGRRLIKGGAITLGVGLGATATGFVMTAIGAADAVDANNDGQLSNDEVPGVAIMGILTMYSGITAAAIGSVLLDAGIPLTIIGKSRLNWVAEQVAYPSGQNEWSLRFGNTPNGLGLTLNF